MGTLRGAATSWRTRSTSSKGVEGRPLASDKGETALLSAVALGGSTAGRSLSSPWNRVWSGISVVCIHLEAHVQSSLL